ncbi:MAG: prepilin-type N-terminal cleavage/methylation domain-containing protein [Burkholderiales bacterium]|nr:prepilin-type N-terminal cleavage/methylation domain-containing protein [Burkholderiales bacterium]
MNGYRFLRQGVTLIEMLVGVAVLGVILAVAIPSLTSLLERRRVVAAAGEVANLFTFARSEANVVSAQQVNVHLEPVPSEVGSFSCMRVSSVSGGTDRCGCDLDASSVCSRGGGRLLREFVLPNNSSVRFDTTGTWGLVEYVVPVSREKHFNNISAKVTVTGTKTGAQLRVEYNAAGRVRTCAPNSDFSGYPACT